MLGIQAIQGPRLRGDGGEESPRAWCMLALQPNGQFDPMKEALMSAQPRKVVHPDIKPENTPELASRYLDVPNMPWEPTKFAGIQIKVLYSDDSGMTTALFKLDPGAVVPLHEHTALEQTFVLKGTLEDHEGVCGPGQFVWRTIVETFWQGRAASELSERHSGGDARQGRERTKAAPPVARRPGATHRARGL